MALNIRNRETEELAQELASLTGETKTEAVRRALRDQLVRLQRERPRRGGCLWRTSSSLVIESRQGAEGLRELDFFLDRAGIGSAMSAENDFPTEEFDFAGGKIEFAKQKIEFLSP